MCVDVVVVGVLVMCGGGSGCCSGVWRSGVLVGRLGVCYYIVVEKFVVLQ